MGDDLLLAGDGLRKSYGGVVAVNDVSVQLHAGEVLGLVGPNGAGKTTLVDLISGAQHADHGALRLRGKRLSGPPSRRSRAGLARTFQYPLLSQELTVRENILVGRVAARLAGPHRMVVAAARGLFVLGASASDEQAVERAAADLHLHDLDVPCGALTLGEQRLVEVARALVQEPLVLLLDEPFAGADTTGIAAISDVITLVKTRGFGVILVDHNVDVVAALADRIMLLDQGRTVFDGDPGECLQSREMQRVYFGTVEGELDDA